MSEKKYHVGYVMGVFDLFHVGHLNLVRRAKEQCDYLIVGILTDGVVSEIKHIVPVIPFEQRKEIMEAIRYVDEVVAIDEMKYLSKVNEWHRHPFDCLFSGDDYSGNEYWMEEKRVLNTLGSDIQFFPYTKTQSSTKIKKTMSDRENKKE